MITTTNINAEESTMGDTTEMTTIATTGNGNTTEYLIVAHKSSWISIICPTAMGTAIDRCSCFPTTSPLLYMPMLSTTLVSDEI